MNTVTGARVADLPLVQALARIALAVATREASAAAEGIASPADREPTLIARRRRRRSAA